MYFALEPPIESRPLTETSFSSCFNLETEFSAVTALLCKMSKQNGIIEEFCLLGYNAM
jgi:hypothetical protein